MTSSTNLFSFPDIKKSSHNLDFAQQLQEVLVEHETNLTTELQKKLVEINAAMSLSILPKQLSLCDYNQEVAVALAEEKDSPIPKQLHVLSHVFLERDLKGSYLEGMATCKLIEVIKEQLHSIKIAEDIKKQLLEAMEQMYTIENLIKNDVAIPRDEVIKEIKIYLLDQASTQHILTPMQYLALAKSVNSPLFQSKMEKFLDTGLILSEYLEKNILSIRDTLPTIIAEILEEESQGSNLTERVNDEEISNLPVNLHKIPVLRFDSCKEQFYRVCRQNNKAAVDYIKMSVLNLKPRQRLAIPSGYIDLHSGHAMVLIIEKNEDDTANIFIINTGNGTKFHARMENIQIESQGKKICTIPKRPCISGLFNFYHVPLNAILAERNGEHPFLQYIIDCKTLPFHLYYGKSYHDPANQFYKMIASYLMPYLNPIHDEDEKNLFIYGQESGTCVWSSIKTLFRFYIQEKQNYYEFSHQFKTNLLVATFKELTENCQLSQEAKKIQANLIYRCAKYFITSIEEKITKKLIITDTEKVAIATSVDIIERISTYLETNAKVYDHSSLLRQDITFNYQKLSDDGMTALSNLSPGILDSETTSEPASNFENLVPDQILTPSPFVYFSSIQNMVKDLKALRNIQKFSEDLFHLYIEEYIDSIKLEDVESINVENPQHLLLQLSIMMSYINAERHNSDISEKLDNAELKFSRNWKAYLLATMLIQQIDPELLTRYPLECFGFLKQAAPLHFLGSSNKTLKNLKSCLAAISRHNKKAEENFANPLFHNFMNVLLNLNCSCTETIEKDATINLYLHLIDKNPDLQLSLLAMFKARLAKGEPYENPSNLELSLFLYEDFCNQTGILKRHRLGYITDLKMIFFLAYNSLKKPNIYSNAYRSDMLIDKTAKILRHKFGHATQDHQHLIFTGHFTSEIELFIGVDSIHRNEIQSNDINISWANLSADKKESILLKKIKEISKIFPSLNNNETYLAFLLDLQMLGIDDPMRFNILFTILSRSENEECLNNKLLFTLVQTHLLSFSNQNPEGTALIELLKQSESLRINISEFILLELSRFSRSEKKNVKRICWFLNLAIELKLQLHPLPFLSNLKEHLLLANSDNCETISNAIFDYYMVIVKELSTEEDILDLLLARLQIRILSPEKKLFFSRYLHAISNILVSIGINQKIKDACVVHCDLKKMASEIRDIYYDKDRATIWVSFKENQIGIDLQYHKKIIKADNDDILLDAKEFNAYITTHPLFKDLKQNFDQVYGLIQDEQMTIQTRLGSFDFLYPLQEEDVEEDLEIDVSEYDFFDSRVIYTPSQAISLDLPEKYKNIKWNFITNILCSLADDGFCDNEIIERKHLIFDDITREYKEIFKNLPLFSPNIYYSFIAQTEDNYAILSMNSSLQITYIFEVNIDSKEVLIYDVANKKVLHPIDKDSSITTIMPYVHCVTEFTHNDQHICIIDEQNRSIRLQYKGKKLTYSDEISYTFVATEHEVFPYANPIMVFQSDSNPSDYFVLTSDRPEIIPTQVKSLMSPHLFAYKIKNKKINPVTLCDELYLCALKIQNQSPDRFYYINKIKDYRYQKPSEQVQKFMNEILSQIFVFFDSAGFTKDEFCLLAMHLGAFSLQTNGAAFNKDLFFEMYTYYKTLSRIPDQHLIPIDLERIILHSFFDTRYKSTAAEWLKYLNFFRENGQTITQQPVFHVKHYFTVSALPPSANLQYKKQDSKKQLSLFTPVSFAEIAECEKISSMHHMQGSIFDILFEENYFENSNTSYVILKMCRYLDKEIFTTLEIDPLQNEESLINALLEKKNRAYINQLLYSWEVTKPKKVTLTGKTPLFLHTKLIEPFALRKNEKSIACLEYLPSEQQYRSTVFKKSLSLSKIHILSEKIAVITGRVLCSVHNFLASRDDADHTFEFSEPISIDARPSTLALSLLHSKSDKKTFLKQKIEGIDRNETAHHLKVFFNSLNTIIEQKEKSLLETINHFHQSTKEAIIPLNPFLLLAGKHSTFFNYNTFDTLLDCFLDAYHFSYTFQIQPLKYSALQMLQSSSSIVKAIHEEIANVLLLKIWQRKLEPVKKGILSGLIPPSLDICIDFSEKNIHWLVFEYITGFDLRAKQRELLAQLEDASSGQVKHHVAQMMMGQGKTSVIIPLLSYSSSDTQKISLILCLKSQLKSLTSTLTLFQNDVFSQKVIDLDIQRKDITEKSLKNLWEDLSSAQKKKHVFIAASESLQALELEFINMIINKATNTNSFIYLQKILKILLEQCNCIVDEFAHIADVGRVTNFPLLQAESNIKKVPVEHIDMMRDLFIFILSKQDSAFQKIVHNEQIYLTEQELSLIAKEIKCFIKNYFLNKHPSVFEEAFIDHILCQQKIDRASLQEITDNPQKEASIKLCLAHLCLKAILPKVLTQCGGRNYGRSIDPKRIGKIIPYQGVGSPATTEFGFAYEAIAYHFMYAAQFGLDANHITAIAKRLQNEAMVKSRALMIPLDQTEESLLFYSLTGVTLTESKKAEGINAAVKKLKDDKEKGQISAILQLEGLNAFEHVLSFEKHLSSTPHNLFSQFKTVRGLTGTPWNHPTYGVNFAGHIHLDTDTEEQITQVFCTKPYVQGLESFAYITKEKQAGTLLSSILDIVHEEERKNISAIVDTGGLFKEHTNAAIAEQILTTLKQKNRDETKLISVLFFSSDNSTPLPDIPHIMQWNSCNQTFVTFAVSDFSVNTLNSHNILTNPYFVYFDERHSIGTDIPMAEKAVILITTDSNTPFFQFSQGVMRARRFLLEQRAITIIPQSMLDKHPQITRSAHDLVILMKHNEKFKLASQLHRSYKMQLEDTCRSVILNTLLSTSSSEAKSPPDYQMILESFSDLLIKDEMLCPLKIVTDNASSQNVIDELTDIVNDILQRLKKFNISDSHLARVNNQLDKILSRAKLDPLLCHSSDYNSLFSEVVIENHVDQEQHQHQDQQIEEEMLQEITSLKSGYIDTLKNDIILPWESIIFHFTLRDTPFVDLQQDISILQISSYEACPFTKPFHKAFNKIYLTNNAIGTTTNDLTRLFIKEKRQLFSLLIVKQNDYAYTQNHVIVALTYSETKQVYDLIQSKRVKGVFLLNMQGQTICDSYESLDLHNIQPSIDNARVETLVFNMHISELTKISSAAYQWLNPTGDLENLGSIRESLLKLICVISDQKDLLSIVKTIHTGELLDHHDRKRVLASQIICMAQEALSHGNERLARWNLFHLPTEFLCIIPQDLLHVVSQDHLSKLFDRKQITSLAQKDCIYLRKGQMKFLTAQKIQSMIESARRDIELDPNFPFIKAMKAENLPTKRKESKESENDEEKTSIVKRFKSE